MWNSSINAELMVKTDFYSKYIHIHNYNAKSSNFEKMRCKVRMRISYYKAFSSATVRFFPVQTINEAHNLSCYRPEPSPSALITSIRNTGCSIALFFPSILRFILIVGKQMMWWFTLARLWWPVVSLSHWTFVFTIGLCVDDGDRPGLRIHLQLCNTKWNVR
jgi:hypothetical protein